MKQYANLHTHSVHSDGEFTPAELVTVARAEGYYALAITDHDTVTAYPELKRECDRHGLECLFGCEFTSPMPELSEHFHITAYGFDPEHPAIRDYLSSISTAETARTRKLFEHGVENGLISGIEWDEVLSFNEGIRWLSNGHIFRAMKAKGLITDAEFLDFYDTVIAAHRFKIPLEVEYLSPSELIPRINEAGGVAIVAHPHAKLQYIEMLMGYGLSGLEVWHHDLSDTERIEALTLAKRHGLYISGGSDHEGLLGGGYKYVDSIEESHFYEPVRSLGTARIFFDEIKNRVLNPDRDRVIDECINELRAAL